MTSDTPVGYMKMASGKLVPVSRSFGEPKAKVKKFLLVLQYYSGDVEDAEQLASLIADLERTRNRDTDIMLFRRADSREMNDGVRKKLEAKFDRVILQACRRTDAKSYPMGANQMWSDLVTLMAQVPPFATDYYAFLNLESDCVPTRPGWIAELIAAWKTSFSSGKPAMGHIHDNPVNHLNGVAVYSADIFRRVASNKLLGGSPQTAYDIYFANFLRPHASDTPLIYFEYRRPTITATELFAPRKSGIVPALWHGVKDGTARTAVRARHITFTDTAPTSVIVNSRVGGEPMFLSGAPYSFPLSDTPAAEMAQAGFSGAAKLAESLVATLANVYTAEPPKRANVYTYHQPAGKANADEQQAIQSLWRTAWTSRGFNPVVLTLRDAARNPRYDEFQIHIERFPFLGGKKESMNRFNRWLALEMAGGGLMVDVDVLPGEFTPKDIEGETYIVLSPQDSGVISAAIFSAQNLVKFIHDIEEYDPRPEDKIDGRLCVTDFMIYDGCNPDNVFEVEYFRNIVADHAVGLTGAKLVRFPDKGAGRRSDAMRLFLSGNPSESALRHETELA